ncbi:hypothetical protein B0H14DRAFT_2452446 [Mycena olivaceomarginata]|nr:hypothetical protein B0H14DRAFT_2452446 [Mycena olivaceomarginata]
MDLQPRSEPEFTIVSPANVQSTPNPGAFFPHASGFTIGGGVFTSNVNVTNHVHSLPQELTAFRTILLGDIKLIKELRVSDESGVVGRQNRDKRVRRMYSAKVMGGETGRMTVAMYQGARVEEEWQQHLTIYKLLRHPNVMQLYGLANTSALRAMVFHDDLIPFDQFIGRFRHSPILTLYIYSYCNSELDEATGYFFSVSPRITSISSADFTYWIRPTNGELCVDFVERNPGSFVELCLSYKPPRLEELSLDDPDAEAVITAALDGTQYHALCSSHPMAHYRRLSVSTQLPIRSEQMIYRFNSQNETWFRITEPLRYDRQNPVWYDLTDEIDELDPGEVLPNSWTRHNAPLTYQRHLEVEFIENQPRRSESWLAQANHIFTQLQETAHSEDYVCVSIISFMLQLLPNACNTDEPDGYLFVCPSEDFRVGPDLFRWPDCPAYWSLDPSGAARLSTEDAKNLGFPIIHIETILHGRSWDSSVYDGLRQFHRGKGFDPDSREAAIHCGYPLYELSSEPVGPFPCAEIPYPVEANCHQEDPAVCQALGHCL